MLNNGVCVGVVLVLVEWVTVGVDAEGMLAIVLAAGVGLCLEGKSTNAAGVAVGAGAGLAIELTWKVKVPGGVAAECDPAVPFAGLVTFESLVGVQTLGDLTRRKVFSLCLNGCDGKVPERGARLAVRVDLTSALVNEFSAAFISPGKVGRTGWGIMKPGAMS